MLGEFEFQQVLQHEMVHVRQIHSADKIIARVSQIILWVNPFAYAFSNAIEANHEYEVDQLMTKSSSKEMYADLILKLAVPGTDQLSNQFNKFPLSRRIFMIFGKPSKNLKKLLYVLVLPLIVLSFLVFANRETQKLLLIYHSTLL
ncbi:MAG: M56 family metallopeptidase [Daejeonella sp.]